MRRVLLAFVMLFVIFSVPIQAASDAVPVYTIDQWDDSDVFMSDAIVWNVSTQQYDRPVYVQRYFNETSGRLNIPSPDYQFYGGLFNLSIDRPTQVDLVIHRMYGESGKDGFIGEEFNKIGYATTGILFASTNRTEVIQFNAFLNVSDWNASAWYKMVFNGQYIDSELGYSLGIHESRVFYFNTTGVENVGLNVQTDYVHYDDPKKRIIKYKKYLTAADGDISNESITSFSETLTDDTGLDPDSDTNADAVYSEWDFSETLDDDVMYYPDSLYNDTEVTASAASYTGDSEYNTYTSTQVKDGTSWQISVGAVNPATVIAYLNMSVPSDVEGFVFNFYVKYAGIFGLGGITTNEIAYYDGSTWQDIGDLDSAYGWVNSSIIYSPDAISDANVMLRAKMIADCDVTSGGMQIYLDYVKVNFYMMTQSDSGYAESFADVSDWTILVGDGISSDGDISTLEIPGDNVYDNVVDNSISMATQGYFLEVRHKENATTGVVVIIVLKSEDNYGGTTVEAFSLSESTSWKTERFFMTSSLTTESIALVHKSTQNALIQFDYLRIGTVMGWSHDGSTTEGITDDSGGSSASDGDELTLTADADGSAFNISIDTTSTGAYLSSSYYSWIELDFNDADSADYVKVEAYDGSAWATVIANTTVGTSPLRGNIKEVYDYIEKFRISVNPSANPRLVYFKAYGFNNWTYSTSAVNSLTTSVAYYDSSEDALVLEKTFDANSDYIALVTRNQSIGYDITDMVALLTVKASANSSCRVRTYHDYSSGGDIDYYYLSDSYQTIAVPLTTSSLSLDYIKISIYDWSTASPSSGTFQIYIKDNITIRPSWYDASSESGTYGESFASISDWSVIGGNTPTSDGDIMSWSIPNDSAWDFIQTDVPSNADEEYLEIRYKSSTAATDQLRIYLATGDDYTGTTSVLVTLSPTTTWATYKIILDQAVESIRFGGYSTDNAVSLMFDYIRIAPSTQMGYQIDCSSVNYEGGTGEPYFSDGDILEIDGTGASYAYFSWNTFSLKLADYPFVEFKMYSASDAELSITTTDEDDAAVETGLTEPNSEWKTYRYNLLAMIAGDYLEQFQIKFGKDGSQVGKLDYIMFYSIANFTVTQGALQVNDIIYVDSNDDIVFERTTASYFILDYDPALSMTVDTFNVWNLTLSNIGTDVGASYDWRPRFYVDSVWQDSSDDNDETRGVFDDLSGTLTDVKFVNYESMTLSAIEFWEDNTAPIINNFWTVPYTPTEEDAVSLSIYTTDGSGYEIYSVTFNAIDSPATFNDIDYSASLSANQGGLWTYSFADGDLPAGYYAWKVTVNDGANEATDIECFRVTTIYLQISDIVLITATDTLAQLSGHSNKDASYVVYENDTNVGSGSVSDGWFSISWTKESTAGIYVELGIKFTASIYTEWINGSYSTASSEVLQINDLIYSENTGPNYLSGYASLACSYYVYENGSQVATGSLSAGRFSIDWTRDTSTGLIVWGAKFTDGTTTRWVNGSYYNAAASVTEFSLTLWQSSILDYHINIDWATSWDNSTLYAYDNDTLEATGTSEDATLVFTKSSVVGVHVLDFKIDGGGSVIWKNNTKYEIAQDQIVLSSSYYGEDENSWHFSAVVNQDVNYYTYDNDTLVSSGTKTTGFFSLSNDFVNAVGKHIVKIKFNTTDDEEYAGGSYDVDNTLVFTDIDPDQDNQTVVIGFLILRTASSTLSYTVYETISSEVAIATGSLTITTGYFISIGFEKSSANIEGNATIIFSDGVSTVNVTVIYIIVEVEENTTINTSSGGVEEIYQYFINETLLVSDWRLLTVDNTVHLVGYINMQASYSVYQDGSEVLAGSVNKGTFDLYWDKTNALNVNVTAIFSVTGDESYHLTDFYADEGILITEDVAIILGIGVPLAVFLVLLVIREWGRAIINKLRGGLRE